MNPFLRDVRKSASARRRPLVVGHRGAMGLAPENTLESFELAYDLGADLVELDVHLTRDGQLVVIHDDTLDRTTDAKARTGRTTWVSRASLADIQALDAGRWFVLEHERARKAFPWGPSAEEAARWLDASALARFASGKVRAPALHEVLGLAKRRGKGVNVELKTIPRGYAGIVPVVVAAVRTAGMVEQVVLSSFDHQTIAEAKRLAPEIPGACLEVSRLASPGRYVAEIVGADGWNPSCVPDIDTLGFGTVAFESRGDDALDRASVADAHARGVSVFVWTENDPARLASLARLGVDAIITDFPNRLAAVLEAP